MFVLVVCVKGFCGEDIVYDEVWGFFKCVRVGCEIVGWCVEGWFGLG